MSDYLRTSDLERLEKTRRDYVANVSHELENAADRRARAIGTAQRRDDHGRRNAQRYYRIMLREVVRLSRLITDMLRFLRPQSGTEHMDRMRSISQELLQDTRQNYANEAAQRGIELKLIWTRSCLQ
ncbi:MAG: hypothetical protein R2881_02325 [Eubacteriales bacterium]